MRAIVTVLLCLVASIPCIAADEISGRWQGQVQVPGRPLTLTVDLAKNASGAWIGSVIIPELNMNGTPLADISADAGYVAFATKNASDNATQIAFRGAVSAAATTIVFP